MHRYLKTEGIVIKKRQLMGKDTIITFFTLEQGKITAIAKGVRKIVSKRLSSLMTGNLIQMVLYERKEYYYIQSAQIISIFSRIKKDEQLLKQLYFFLFILDQLLPERQKETSIYFLFKRFLIELSRGELEPIRMKHYCDNLLTHSGYRVEADTLVETIVRIEQIMGKKVSSLLYN
ncbi:DNA repair protein RecO [Candidatus Roizmanbacteria bacterium RIFOXYB2_FULL_38_10]|uniref:DNA repair protein RecO n=1 Tax=Candidatus Roizmanbacteria bacterium RIFOXYD1_FULL_38_12 TaxID=1802093 RepID=A0A1F7L047_9BACT|nr:MAG: DNA repair protein RecO [Candidatus Roizmanbacteria bacterium RIFOXYA2_FULL_38_14]OGK63421.1 MAG: DNA repair protein RecO [Candidatus Roizmanbacteria bacterium RIFOXYA1_FULL_37_12]OGK65267.1 MAG: DNA repair protein RecO [Candidatus Roizmanbacteria bacterium RIFOXYB1_FULL_40_23]OGK68820.1 MAG: DNA repair protein RecO [Candidatus Roizmanbacteria bacterium RIFOXYB2_FULL_38_10]OGK69672.1 MAG: DNA repair protein RecO [Candidatus Roizmanbacteria bacterium RIFOXYC1_FULL_38_14]OGK73414.1 MAG: 